MITIRLGLIALLLTLASCHAKGNTPAQENVLIETDEFISKNEPDTAAEIADDTAVEIPAGVQALMIAYPDFIAGYDDNKILLKDGSSMQYDDGIKKSFDQKLDNSDIEDMFGMRYCGTDSVPGYLDDAGRSRNEALFKKMYGASEGAVRNTLVTVPWFGGSVQLTKVNGAADSLRKVYKELSEMKSLHPYLKSSGTFYWRKVRGANRQSAHSYGIAFDIGVDKSDYWKWKNPNAKETDKIKYHNRIPKEIVEVFERHGFIWGGAWYHFDTMHFEFRPEILEYRRRQ